jgi:8-oxo-dGTP pyrophosphatase MutT (NUDIX family)
MHLDAREYPVITVGGVVYRRTRCGKLRLLLIKKQAGFWTLPKGRVIPGEALVEAVAREVTEETGLSGVVETAVDQLSYTVHKKGAVYNKVVRYYLLRANGGILRPEKKEGIVGVRWFPKRAALRRLHGPHVRAVAQQAICLLTDEQLQCI